MNVECKSCGSNVSSWDTLSGYCLGCAQRMVSQYGELEVERDEWRNMVAVLCGDGGHYHADHGTAATRAYIEKRMFDLRDQHDKLVAMLRKQQRIMMTFCGYCGGNPCRPDCELAALLDEEKP